MADEIPELEVENPELEVENSELGEDLESSVEDSQGKETETEDSIVENRRDQQVGEWAICGFLVFTAVLFVLVLCDFYGEPAVGRSADLEISRTLTVIFLDFWPDPDNKSANAFPVDIAVIILLISIISAFCGLISLAADKPNKKTWIMRSVTLGPLLPIFVAISMILLITDSENQKDKSIMKDIIGTTEVIEDNSAND